MVDSATAGSGRGAGRPRHQDRLEVLAYFTASLSAGETIAEAAKDACDKDKAVRALASISLNAETREPVKEATLIKRRNEWQRELTADFERAVAPYKREGARLVGFSNIPQPPLSFTPTVTPKRGRPKKKRGS